VFRRGGDHTVALRFTHTIEKIADRLTPRSRSEKVLEASHGIADEIAEKIGDGVLLHPPLFTPAPKHGRTVGRGWWILPAAIFNLARVPVTEVPMGLNSDGIPLGVQVAAGRGRDHVSIAVARYLERTFGGWVPPPPLRG
ncbi:MAG: amidase, partial [Thermoleophilaceae bacterium]|nr:amidase [Thermoleophilaceae bacterium]